MEILVRGFSKKASTAANTLKQSIPKDLANKIPKDLANQAGNLTSSLQNGLKNIQGIPNNSSN